MVESSASRCWSTRVGRNSGQNEPCIPRPPRRILLGYPNEEEREDEDVKAAQVTQAGAGEAAETQQEAGEAMATQQGARGVAKTQIRARIALAILESAEALDHASAIVDRLDGAYIHDDDWDEEGLPWLAWDGEDAPTPGGDPSPRARPTRMTQPRPRVDEAGAVSRGRGAPGVGGQCGRYSQATPSLSRSRRGL